MTNAALRGKPDAGNPHVRFDEGEVASVTTPRRGSLLYKGILVICAAVAASVAFGTPERTLTLDDYRDRMKAAWVGQMVGVSWGQPTEWMWKDDTIPEDKIPVWTSDCPVRMAYNNDDLYVEMTFLKTLDDYGLGVSIRQAGIDFANSEYKLWCANAAGRSNLRRGIAPPDSSSPKYNKCPNDIDYQIESDYAGIISPGCPQEVLRLGNVFGRLMNFGDGVWAGQFVGAMYAEAFFTSDVNALLDAGLAAIPAQSDYAKMVRNVRRWHRENPKDWTKCWEKIRANYSKDAGAKIRDSNGAIDARLNGACIVLGLLYGEGDLDKSIILSMRCGWDSDCNPSNVGGILFAARGFKSLDAKYIERLDYERKFTFTDYNLPRLFATCEKLARQVVVRNGGRIEKDASGAERFVVPVRKPEPDAYVPSWDATEPEGVRYTKDEMLKVKVFQPGVKEYKPMDGKVFDISSLQVVYEPGETLAAAAGEVPSSGERCEAADGKTAGAGVFIGVASSDFGKSLAKRFSLSVPEKPQGYALAAKDGAVAIVGHDPVGALYGAETLRQMVDGGRVAPATIRDWPDILYRGSVSIGRGLWKYGDEARDRAAAIKACIDEMARMKLNMVTDPYWICPMTKDEAKLAWWRDIFRYARVRGVYANDYGTTALYSRFVNESNVPDGVTADSWPCVHDHRPWGDQYFCWADDAQTEAAANRYADYLVRAGLDEGIVIIHPVDTGSWQDPEMWSRRCAKCRERWNDHERWKASVNQFGIWIREMKKRCPRAIVGSCIVPYKFNVLLTPESERSAKFNESNPEYWRHLDQNLDKDFFFSSWICADAVMREIRKIIPSRQFHFSDTYPWSAGIFEAYHRKAATVWEADSANMFSNQGQECLRAQWESMALISECTWNKDSPAVNLYDGQTYYDPELDHAGDSIVFTETLPRICRAFWGRDLAPEMAKVLASGILPEYLIDPPKCVSYWNSTRKNAEYDPLHVAATAAQKPVDQIVDTPERMATQVVAAKKCVAALESACEKAKTLPDVKRRYFMTFAKSAPYWLATAKARLAVRRGNALAGSGRNREAVALLEKARMEAERDYATADANVKALADEKDALGARYEWPYGCAKALAEIDRSLSSARVILKPRRAGRVVKVGITSGPSGEATKRYLDKFVNVKAELIPSIALSELDKYDCVFVMSGQWDRDEFYANVRAYAERGAGGVYLEGPLGGNKRFDTRPVFPEVVASSPKHCENFKQIAKRRDGSEAKTMYVDYFSLVPGKDGEVVATSGDGTPLAVKGEVGLGKAFCCGTFNLEAVAGTYAVSEGLFALSGLNAELAKEAVEYFSGAKLVEKGE